MPNTNFPKADTDFSEEKKGNCYIMLWYYDGWGSGSWTTNL